LKISLQKIAHNLEMQLKAKIEEKLAKFSAVLANCLGEGTSYKI